MKIIHILTGLGVGGAERLALNLAKAQFKKDQGLDISILTLNSDTRIMDQYDDVGLKIKTLGLFKSQQSLKRSLIFLRTVRRFKSEKIIIHAHMFHSLLFAILMKLINWKIKIVFTSHNFGGFTFLRSLIVMATKIFRYGDILLGEGQHPRLNKNPRIIPNAVAQPAVIDKTYKKKSSFVFIVVGRLDYVKNPFQILDSFLSIKGFDASLIFVGDGPLRSELENKIALSGSETVYVKGNVSSITDLYREADCLVMASHWEGLPMVILEAGSFGLGVISSPVGAIPGILNSDRGFLVEPRELSDVMQMALENPNLCREAGLKLQKYIFDEHSIESSANKHIKFYKEALNSHHE